MPEASDQTGIQSGQSSSQSQGQSTQGAAEAQAGVAQTGVQNSGQTQTQQTATRPEKVPERFWNADKGEVNHEAWRTETDRLSAAEAMEISRKASVPPPDKYELKFDKDFKLPEGVDYQINADDPVMPEVRKFANEIGLNQDQFSKLMGLYAASQVGEQQQIKTAKAAELSKLGATANTRVDAVKQFLGAVVGDQLAAAVTKTLLLADQVKAFEVIMHKFSSQGGSSYSGAHREVNQPERVSNEAYSKMTYSEKKEYASKFGMNGATP